MIRPLKTHRFSDAAVLGFDTEYTSKGARLLSVQLAYGDKAEFFPIRELTVDALAELVISVAGLGTRNAVLVSYYSFAELQFLPVKTEAFRWREYGGSFDCSFYSKRHGCSVRLFDLARFFERRSLATVAESFGLKKLPWNTTEVTAATVRDKAFREYAKNDAVITLKIFEALRVEFAGRGTDILVSETPARASSEIFRSQYVTKEIANRNSRARFAGMRSAWGGRAEAFRVGSFPQLFEYDLQGAYPNACISFGSLPATKNWAEILTLKGIDSFAGGFAQVRFEFPLDEIYPCLPRAYDNSLLYFTRGVEWVTLDEIRLARSMGADVELLEGWGYKAGTTELVEFMRAMVDERKTAKGARRVMLKLAANSIIGKLAQRTPTADLEALWKVSQDEGIAIEDLLYLPETELAKYGITKGFSVGSCFMPEWNALITGRVRAEISKLARETEAVYCATDAIWARKEQPHIHATFSYDTGIELKRRGPGQVFRTKVGRIDDPKEKADGYHVVHHGIHSRAVADAMMRSGAWKATYVNKRPVKIRESLLHDKPFAKWGEFEMTASLGWDMGRALNEDGTTRPWRDVEEYDAAAAGV